MAQGNDNGVQHTDTIDSIHKHKVSNDRGVTYATFVLDHGPLKTEEYGVRITVGGGRILYAENSCSSAAYLLETRVLINSVILDAKHGAKFMTACIKDYFLDNSMARAEYIKSPIQTSP